jgi:hypothetical protein
MKNKTYFLIAVMVFALTGKVYSQAQCTPTTAQAELEVNNVRTTIMVGGDMWWDLVNPKYEVPKGSGKHSIFAGSLWIGGVDDGGQVKVAAQTYRQTGADFWGGPLDTTNTTITQEKCRQYDRLWKVTRSDVENFIENPASASNDIKNWPGNGDPLSNEGHYLAPFYDVNGDGFYNYQDGDYPGYNLSGNYPTVPGYTKTVCNDFLFGDQTIWWVFNDVGNIHSSSGSDPIGLEIRAQAFSFKTNDEINNMTFYKYQIINRSTFRLNETYFGQWVDPDLGNATDDFVGCDVMRGLGFCYNGDADDETANGYGMNPPAVGVDFFQGPIANTSDGIDNDRDGCIDCTFIEDTNGVVVAVPDFVVGEQIIMSKFVYYDNVNNSPIGNPADLADFYNYLRGIWIDNQPITFGGNGRDINAPITNYMFPGTTDPDFPGQNWTEVTAGNTPNDRRFLQSAGSFTLEPGAVNYVTTGVVWARASQGGPLASVDLLRLADDKAQALFDNCFKLLDGPGAPDLAIRELDRRIILSLLNTANDKVEFYHQKDPTIVGFDDSLTYFDFQGYQIYQLKDATVTVGDIGNTDRIRLLAQCDIADGVAQLVNYEYDPVLNANMPVEMVMGADKGIVHTFEIKQDLFATGNTNLVNHKTYFYTVISYAYNEYKKYDPNDPASLDGQKKPYLAGRGNVKTYSAIPHHPAPEWNGQVLNSDYGNQVVLTRIEGQGNGGYALDFTSESIPDILNPPYYRAFTATYLLGKAPLKIEVYDPVLVKDDLFRIAFDGTSDDAHYRVTNKGSGLQIASDYPISNPNQQVYPEWGLTSLIRKVKEPGDATDPNNGFIEATLSFGDPMKNWLTGVTDSEDTLNVTENWIRSGTVGSTDYLAIDDNQIYEQILGGTWAPYKLTAKTYPGPKWSGVAEAQISLSPGGLSNTGIASINVVITSDKSKWSRCAVFETGAIQSANIGNARQYDLRNSPSIGKNGEPDLSVNVTGMSWFPGYAYSLETGERLNIAFAENSSLTGERSQDMMFNPTSRKYNTNGDVVFGGMHYIYIFGHNGDSDTDVPAYDSCRYIATKLLTGSTNDKRAVWKSAMWCTLPLVTSDYDGLSDPGQIPADVTIRLRVARNFKAYATAPVIKNNQPLQTGTLYYVASTPVTHNGITYMNTGDSFTASGGSFTGNGTVTTQAPVNNFNPLYEFNTNGLAPLQNNTATAKDALRMINIVPNPYYAYSAYENSQLDNRVKLVNLPSRCKVSIFTQSGTLVRSFNRDVAADNSPGAVVDLVSNNTETSIDWDLKNHKGIPVASGVYLIHVDAGVLGQRTLKWFGLLRPIDLDTF